MVMTKEPVTLNRNCSVTQIPVGNKLVLPQGTKVRVTQSLGGSYTIMTENGALFRIEGVDADAIGQKAVQAAPQTEAAAVDGETLKKLVWDQLKTCYDPEIPVNIADLGLIYACVITPLPEGGNKVDIKMTLTAPGCGMGESIRLDAQSKISRLPGIKQVNVELVWEPQWNQSMISEAAKLQLGLL